MANDCVSDLESSAVVAEAPISNETYPSPLSVVESQVLREKLRVNVLREERLHFNNLSSLKEMKKIFHHFSNLRLKS